MPTMVKSTKKKRRPGIFHGKPVIIATQPLKLIVTERDIVKAKRKNPEACAMARCALRCSDIVSARIGKCVALLEHKDHFERFSVSTATREMVKEFDANGTFITGEYQLNPPRPRLMATRKMTPAERRKYANRYANTPIARQPRLDRSVFRAGVV